MTAPDVSPERFVADFFNSFTEQALGGEDADAVVDRFYTPDVVQESDGVPFDRARLVAHLRPVRKNLVAYRYEVHEALVDGDRIAARLTIHADLRHERGVSTDVYLFGEVTPDGRLRRVNQLTRTAERAEPAES
ncbi:MAG TPA: nuclear transport factor 2 family protein [Streptosporangiales bacterium]